LGHYIVWFYFIFFPFQIVYELHITGTKSSSLKHGNIGFLKLHHSLVAVE